MKTPDYTAPVMGVREWELPSGFPKNTVLQSVAVNLRGWAPGKLMEAVCLYCETAPEKPASARGRLEIAALEEDHEPPMRDCSCGLYAYYDFDSAIQLGNYMPELGQGVRGVVAAQGKIWPHDLGFRAQKMRIVAFIYDDAYRSYPSGVALAYGDARAGFEFTESTPRSTHDYLAKLYGVPVIGPRDYEGFREDYGGVVLEIDPSLSFVVTDRYPLGTMYANNPTAAAQGVSPPPPKPSRKGFVIELALILIPVSLLLAVTYWGQLPTWMNWVNGLAALAGMALAGYEIGRRRYGTDR